MPCPPEPADLEARLRSALELLGSAGRFRLAGRHGDAQACYEMAGRAHASVLEKIARLTEAEADLLEPSVTRLERALLQFEGPSRGPLPRFAPAGERRSN